MEDAADNHEESAPKRSRSNEEIKADKDVFSSSDSGQQSPHDKQQQEQQQNVSACSSNSNSNNHINNNSDSGLSLKMEDSSCGDADITGDTLLRSENNDENTMATIADFNQLEDQQMLSNEGGSTNIENLEHDAENDEPIAATNSGVDLDKPTTSTNLIRRHKRNRSRNYRVADRSSSSSSNSADENHAETQPEEQAESQESVTAAEGPVSPANNNATEAPTQPSPYMFPSNHHSSSISSISSDSSSDSDDDENNDEYAMVTIADSNQLEDQQMLSNEGGSTNIENLEHDAENDEPIAATNSGVDLDKPTTSTNLIRRHKRNRSRNYRVADRSSSSNSADESHTETQPEEQAESQESVTAAEGPVSPANNNATEEPTQPSPYMFFNYHASSISSISSDSSSDSDDDDTDFEPYLFGDRLSPDFASNDSADSNRHKEKDEEVNKLLNKQKPPYTWCGSYELMRREHGLSGDGRTSLRNGFTYGFKNRFYASRHIVERMKISHVLRKHSGCVNCVSFNKTGNLLVTGSDDARLIVWDWAVNKTKHVWKSGHSANIFQSKFLPSSSCIDIISAGRDGKVRRSIVPPSGGKVQVSHLYPHSGAVHKLVICPDNPSEIISVGEDGCICSKDLREDIPKVDMLKVFSTTKKPRKVRLFSISHHPFAPEICVSGSDQYVRVYDKRSMRDPVHTMSPKHILQTNSINVTCCVYNNTGTEILATYSEDNIYLFDNKNYVPGEYLHSYKGHFNQKTFKGVNFFGPNCEYIISGSDCGNIFYWDKNTEAILNFMPGDTAGVVNCLEPHPNTPILATSGLDHNIKIWTPSAEKHPPDLSKLTNCVRRNIRCTALNGMDFNHGQMQFFIRQILCRHSANRRQRNREANESDSDNNLSSDDSSVPDIHTESDDDDDLRHLACGTQ